MHDAMTLYHFPGCPFSERVEIALALKGRAGDLRDVEVDMSSPRPAWLLEKTGGATALPALETPRGTLLESAAIVRYVDAALPGERVADPDPYRHALEEMMVAAGGGLSAAGYRMIQNQDRAQRDALAREVDAAFAKLDAFLRRYAGHDTWLSGRFGWAETMLTPIMKRLWFLEYYEDYQVPRSLERLCRWRDACLAHPAAQARGFEEIVKLYHDYSRGFGSGKVPAGRTKSSFTLDPHWSTRPMPPRDKWAPAPDDATLGLLPRNA